MEIRITNDAVSHIKMNYILTESVTSEVRFLDVWGVHVFEHHRQNYFLLTEGVSYFSIIIFADSVTSRLSFEKAFQNSLLNALSGLFEGRVPNYLLSNDISYSKTRNDGLRRAQSDQIWRAKSLMDDGTNTFMINRVPYKSLGFKFPVEKFINGLSLRMKENDDYRTFMLDDVTRN